MIKIWNSCGKMQRGGTGDKYGGSNSARDHRQGGMTG